MLTLFTTPKFFQGHFGVIQRNAIHSWRLLHPANEIILFGNNDGAGEIAAEFGLRYVPNVACNEYGTPLLNDLFEQAKRLATYDLLCYINADIVLMKDFIRAVECVACCKQRFLMVGRRWDVDLKERLAFEPDWEDRLRAYVYQNGQLCPPKAIDYFVFPRNLWVELPPFAIGRTAWDNWLLYRARSLGAALIDATQVVMAVHQNHGYGHHPGGEAGVWNGAEAKRNRELMLRDIPDIFSINDATYKLTSKGKRLIINRWFTRRHLTTLPILYPQLRQPLQLLLKVPYPIRARLGLTLHSGEVHNG